MAVMYETRESLFRNAHTLLWLVAALGLAALTYVDRPLLAVGVYTIAVIGTFAVRYGFSGPLFDVRDEDLSHLAGSYTLSIYGMASAIVFPALTVLYDFGYFEWGPWTSAVAIVIASIYVTFGAIRLVLGRRHS